MKRLAPVASYLSHSRCLDQVVCFENENKILNNLHNCQNSYYLIYDSVMIPDDSASLDDPELILLLDPETPR